MKIIFVKKKKFQQNNNIKMNHLIKNIKLTFFLRIII